MGRVWRIIAAVAVLGMLLAACGTDGQDGGQAGDGEQTDGAAGGGEELQRLTVAMHWIQPAGATSWTGLMLARDRGWYEEAGLDVEFRFLRGSTVALQVTGAGATDLGIAAPDTFLTGVAEGLPITAVANHIQENSTGVIVPGDSDVQELTDLAGHTVATAAASPEPAMLQGLLREGGVDPDSEVEFLYVDPQSKCTVMLTGEADACTGFDTFQYPQVRLQDEDARFIPFSTPERPLPGHVIFARNEFLESEADAVRTFLEVAHRGYAAAEEDLEAVEQLWLELDPESDAEFNALSIGLSHEAMHSPRSEESGWGWMTAESWQGLHDLLVQGEVLEEPVELEGVWTNEYLPETGSW